jgi:hypothetical protein
MMTYTHRTRRQFGKALEGLAIPSDAQGWLLLLSLLLLLLAPAPGCCVLRAAACISLHSGRSVRAVGHCELRAGSEFRAPVRGMRWTIMPSSLAGP